MSNNTPDTPQKDRDSRHKFHGRSMTAATIPASALILDVIRREYQPLKYAKEILARHAKATPGAAENWLRGKCCPQADHLVALMQSCPPLRATVYALIEGRE